MNGKYLSLYIPPAGEDFNPLGVQARGVFISTALVEDKIPTRVSNNDVNLKSPSQNMEKLGWICYGCRMCIEGLIFLE